MFNTCLIIISGALSVILPTNTVTAGPEDSIRFEKLGTLCNIVDVLEFRGLFNELCSRAVVLNGALVDMGVGIDAIACIII